ncbi:MAG: tape measure protein [Rothia mucilaginosa]|uniref:Tape measure protein n=1 Tax=Rothia mucilaginosa TaxID=43675 RepID=A0A930KZE5_9MICC|nr:tape measure protein [Rothia mucilaginosa]MBF1659795.1 tape measure protein [Rothia mucilaginosa]
MSKLDERIVSMKFDNKQFEQGIKQTQASLKNFNSALNFDKATASLGAVSDAAKNVKMDPLLEGVEKARTGFKTFEVAAITALANITSKVVDSALQWTKNLVFNAPMEGFKEYETQINAVQTILANTLKEGTNVQTVNKYLDELNTYADKTIYNFTEMTRNIGTFTAAGVKLEPATKAIKGIANLAALSGSNSQQASQAMYQLSQALAAGRVGLQDWNSVVAAGMAGEQFQNLLKDTAVATGAIDKLDKKSKSMFKNKTFRESLKAGWLTADVLTQALDVMTGSMTKADLMAKGFTAEQAEYYEKLGQTAYKAATEVKTFSQLLETLGEAQGSGWAQTWRIILGDFEEAKELFTWLSDSLGKVIGENADARNQMWQTWRDLGGRTAVVNALKNVLTGIGRILGPIRDAWHAVFPPAMGTTLAAISHGLERLTQGLILSEPNAEKLKRIFQGLFSIFGLVTQAVVAVAKGIGALLNELVSLLPRGNGTILEFIAGLADWVTGLHNSAKESEFFLKQVQKFGDWVHWLVEVATPYFEKAAQAISGFGQDAWRALGEFAQLTRAKLEELKAYFVPRAQEAAQATNEELGKIGAVTAAGGMAGWETLKKWFESTTKAAEEFAKRVRKAWDEASSSFKGLQKKFEKTTGTKDPVSEEYDRLMAGTNLTLGAGIGAGLFVLVQRLSGIAKKVKKNLKSMNDVVEKFGKVVDAVRDHLKALTGAVKAKALLTIAFAIGVLAASVWLLSTIDPGKLAVGLGALTVLLAEVMGMLWVMAKMDGLNGAQFAKLALGLIALGVGVLLLAKAAKNLGEMDPWNLAKGLIAIRLILSGLAKAVDAFPKDNRLQGTALGLIALGVSLILIAQAVKMLGTLRWQDLVKGLAGFAVVLAGLVIFTKTAKLDSLKENGAGQLVLMAGALLVIALAVEKIGSLPLAAATQGVLALTVILAAMGGFMALTKNSKFDASSGLGLVAMAVAMERLVDVVARFGTMDLGVLVQGFAALSLILLAVVYGLKKLDKDALQGGAGLLMLGVAIDLVSRAVERLGNMDILALAQGLGAMVVALAGMVGALILMSKFKVDPKAAASMVILAAAVGLLVPAILLLGAAGLGVVAVGVGAVVVALLALAGTAKLLTPAIAPMKALAIAMLIFASAVAVFGLGVLALGVGLATLGTAGGAGIQVLTAAITSLVSTFPYIGQKLAEALAAFLGTIAANVGPISAGISAIVVAILQVLIDAVPKITELVISVILALCNAIIECTPKLVEAGFALILGLLKGLRDNIGRLVTVAAEAIANFIRGIGENVPKIVNAGMRAMIDLCNGMADAIDRNHQELLAAMSRLGGSILNALWDAVKGGLRSAAGFLWDIGSAIVNGIWEGIKAAGRWFRDSVNGFFKGIVDGVKGVLGIRSPSRVFKQIGGYMMEGLSEGVEDGASDAMRKTDAVAQALADAVENTFSNLNPDELGMELNPVVTPVVNLDAARDSAKALGGLFASPGVRLAAGAQAANPYQRSERALKEPTPTVYKTTNVEFTQNNTSPEALDAFTIYRNTQNQLQQIREAALTY